MDSRMEQALGENPLLSQIDSLALLLHESVFFHGSVTGRERIVSILKDAIARLYDTRSRIQASKELQLVFAGVSQVGKTSIVCSVLKLLDATSSVSATRRTTTIPIVYRFGSPAMRFRTRDQLPEPYKTTRMAATLVQEIDEIQENGEALSNRYSLDVQLPSSFLRRSGATVVDLVAFGQASGERNDDRLPPFLGSPGTHIFWVIDANRGIGKIDAELYRLYLAQQSMDIVITGTEQWGDLDRRRFNDFLKIALRQASGRMLQHEIFFASTRQYQTAIAQRSPELIRQSGIWQLRRRMHQVCKNVLRDEAAVGYIIELMTDVRKALAAYRSPRGLALNPCFRPDSYSRWKERAITSRTHATAGGLNQQLVSLMTP